MADSITRDLARFVVDSKWDDVPNAVRHEGSRAILNWLGCALGGCRDELVERMLAALREFSGKPQATLLGRGERLDALTAACINGAGSKAANNPQRHHHPPGRHERVSEQTNGGRKTTHSQQRPDSDAREQTSAAKARDQVPDREHHEE